METKVLTITPQMAQRWLENTAPNRRLRAGTVERYARDMTNGKWQLNGQSIVISSEGRLLDGQHRLQACIKANHPFRSVVVEGVPPEGFETMDSGAGRTVSDMLGLRGEMYTNTLAALTALYWRYEKGWMTKPNNLVPTREESLAVLEAHPEFRAAIESAYRAKHVVSPTTLALIVAVGAKEFDQDTVDLFVDALAEGVGLNRTNAAYVLREKLLAQKGARIAKLARTTVMAITIKAFNNFALEIPIVANNLRWQKGEPFPVISKIPTRSQKERRQLRAVVGNAAQS